MKVERIYTPEVQELRDKILAQIDEARALAFSCGVPMSASRNIWPVMSIRRLGTDDGLAEDVRARVELFRAITAPALKILAELDMCASVRFTPETEEEREWMLNRIAV